MSPSRIHLAEYRLASAQKHCPMASRQARYGRNPYEFGSAVIRLLVQGPAGKALAGPGRTSREYQEGVCLCFSLGCEYVVEVGRDILVETRRAPRYPGDGITPKTPSIPGVLAPLLLDTRNTANNFAEVEWVSSHCKAFTLFHSHLNRLRNTHLKPFHLLLTTSQSMSCH